MVFWQDAGLVPAYRNFTMDDQPGSGLHNPRHCMVLHVVPQPDSSPRISLGAQQINIISHV